MKPLLEVKSLRTSFFTDAGEVRAVDGVSFSVEPGKLLGIVGESGSGKTACVLSIMRLLPESARIVGGEVIFEDQDLLKLSEPEMRHVRGARIAMIFQEPMTSLNPVFTIGSQIGEAVRLHQHTNRAETRNRTIEALRMVGIADPERRVDDYPHQLSGGMRQRVMIAMALSCNPRLLIADEPTTALDVTIQAQILDLIRELQVRLGLAVILVTHDLGIVAEYADDVTILYAARVMEQAPSCGAVSKSAQSVHARIARIDSRHRRHPAPSLAGDSRLDSERAESAGRMQIPSAMPARNSQMLRGRSTAGKQGPQSLCRLHPRLIPSRLPAAASQRRWFAS